ncbi:unnamed protein product [Brassicogethes aeneus]|uniref:Major facilitator superfamily (MFS) profile domain-containing protein n=1 Tax=Brassicogethes aeneus TaxID=1431903 RepID=A0A9P0B7H5_BRAAE|nr:unnamed protein product [Brassicogethes aeneus]
MNGSSQSTLTQENNEIKVYKYRWVVLGIFCLFTINNFVQFLEYSIIADTVKKYYGVDSFAVDISGLIFFIMYLIGFLPVSYLIEKYDMKITAISSTGLTLIGNVIKIFATPKDKFYLVIVGQGFCALGQVYMISIPSKFAALWFGAKEVSTACALAVLGTQFGAALGSIMPTFLVKDGTDEQVREDLMTMVTIHAGSSAVILLIVLIFFRAKPKLPPSQSQLNLLQSEDITTYWASLKKLFKNKDFLIVLLCFGMSNGLFNSFGIVLNSFYEEFFPDHIDDAGYLAAAAIIAGGCIGSIIFGIILDKTHKFKLTSFCTLFLSAVSLVLLLLVFMYKSRMASFTVIPLLGFFLASTLVIGFEYAIEASYPIPESLGCSLLNAAIYLFAIINTLIQEVLFEAIGYLNTMVVGIVVMFIMSFVILFMSSTLKRRDANLESNNTQGVNNVNFVERL